MYEHVPNKTTPLNCYLAGNIRLEYQQTINKTDSPNVLGTSQTHRLTAQSTVVHETLHSTAAVATFLLTTSLVLRRRCLRNLQNCSNL